MAWKWRKSRLGLGAAVARDEAHAQTVTELDRQRRVAAERARAQEAKRRTSPSSRRAPAAADASC